MIWGSKYPTIRRLALLAVIALAAATSSRARAEAPQVTAVVSAASFHPGVARGSLASIFGTSLATSPAVGTLGANGALPEQLGGSVVEVNGRPVPLVYVSANQINLLVPESIGIGTAAFVVKTPEGASVPVTAPIQSVAPGIFMLSCLRADRGAVRNGVTFDLEPFHAATDTNSGNDKRTRLSIFGTGLRFAGGGSGSGVNVAPFVQVLAFDRAERFVPLEVEYAGPAPGFFGLDQVNAVVPPELEGIGLLKLQIAAGEQVSNTVSVVLTPDSIEPLYASNFNIQTVAGTGQPGRDGDGGQAVIAMLQQPLAVALDRHLNLYIADTANRVVRKVTPGGVISRFAGTGEAGSNGDGGPAIQAQLQRPTGLAVDELGNVYIADTEAHRVRRVDSHGIISTFAGAGAAGNSGDGGLATQAQLGAPFAVAVNPYNSLLITDQETHSVRKVTGDGLIQTIAGQGEPGFAGDGDTAVTAMLNSPACVGISPDNTTYFSDALNYRLRRVSPDGRMGTVAGTGKSGTAKEGVSASLTDIGSPAGVALSEAGEVIVSERDNHTVRVIDANCQMRTIAGSGIRGLSGDGGPALQAQLNAPSGMAVDPVGDVYLADSGNNRVRKLWSAQGQACGQVSAIVFDPPVVVEGQSTTGYVRLTCPASSATTLPLVSSESTVARSEDAAAALSLGPGPVAALVPGTVTIPAGQTTATFTVKTPVTSRDVFVEVLATSGGEQTKGAFTAIAGSGSGIEIVSLRLASDLVTAGSANTGLIRLGRPAPPGGAAVFLSTDQSAARVQPSVIVPEGQVYVEFLIPTDPVDSATTVTVGGATSSASESGQFVIVPKGDGPGLGKIFSLDITPGAVEGGQPALATVTLESAATGNGVLVELVSNSGAATVPESVVVPAGSNTVQFEVATSVVANTVSATVTATSLNSVSDSLVIQAEGDGPGRGIIAGLSLSPTTVEGGQTSTGTITLDQPAPLGGILVDLSSNSASAIVPASLVIPAGSATGTFSVLTTNVATTVAAQITAASENTTSAALTIDPSSSGSGTLLSLSLSPKSVAGLLDTSTGTVSLNEPAPEGGVSVALASNNSAAVVPAAVTVPAGETSATFVVSTNLVLSEQNAVITATSDNTVSDTLTVNPPLPTDGTLLSFTISPNPVSGGLPATGTITLSEPAPTGGVQVDLSSNSLNATVPPFVLILAGATSATVPIVTLPVLDTTVVNITATSGNSITRPLTIEPLTPGNGTLQSLSISPGSVTGLLESATGTVTLSSAAPSQGVLVTLSSNNPAAVVPPAIIIPGGSTSGTFAVTTTLVLSSANVTITASSSNSVSDTLTVEPPLPVEGTISSFTITPSSVTGGQAATGTITLSEAAPVGGVQVNLSSSSISAIVPPIILVPAGSSSTTVPIATVAVLSTTVADITATSANAISRPLTIEPLAATSAPLSNLSISPSVVTGLLQSATGTVSLSSPAPAGGVLVSLSSNNPAAVVSPALVIPSGQTSANFTITTTLVLASATVTITATSSNSVSDTLTVEPPLPTTDATIASVSVSPSSVTGGQAATGTVTLTEPAPIGGVLVSLSSNSLSATVLPEVLILAGSTSANFPIVTTPVLVTTPASITASANNSKSATLTVNPLL